MTPDPDLEAFCAFFNKLDKSYTKNLYRVYTDDVVFTDPVHRVEGRAALEAYFASLYARIIDCRFDFHERQRQGNNAFVTWLMTLRHPRLAGGRPIRVEGCSHLTFATADPARVCRHRDYFDAGAMLYEHLPLLGPGVRWVKRRLAD